MSWWRSIDLLAAELRGRGYAPSFGCLLEAHLPRALSDPLWDGLALEAKLRVEDELRDPLVDDDPPKPRAPARRRRPTASSPVRGGARSASDDALLGIAPVEFVERLAGVEAEPDRAIRCPLPGHDDRWPSFRVYADPERGVWCFGCQRGGSIYDFAAALWGHEGPLRGSAFRDVRARLLEVFALEGSAAA